MSLPPHPLPSGAELRVRGAIPLGLTGRLTAVGDGLIHSLDLRRGRVTHLARTLHTAAAVRDLAAVDGAVLAFTADAAVAELSPTGGSRRIDLAGGGRSPVTGPTVDPVTGELHLVARGPKDDHLHVVVSAGRLTRRSRLIGHAPGGIAGHALSRDHALVVADGALGILRRDGEAPATWVPAETPAPRPVQAYELGDTVVLVVLTPSLERWILHPDSAAVVREVLDPAPVRFARSNADGRAGSVWTSGGHTISRHGLGEPRSTQRKLVAAVPGDFVLVPAPAHSRAGEQGWFVGLVHDTTARSTEVRVIDMADLASQPVGSVGLPQRLPVGARCAWTPEPQNSLPADPVHIEEHPS